MRKLLLIMVLFLPFAGLTQKFNAGIMLGGVLSQVDGDTWDGFHKFGYLGGGYVSLRLSSHSSFQMEMQYIQKGSRKNADSADPSGQTYLLRIHYLEIPVLYQYTFARRFSAEIGPAADILLGLYEESNGLEVTNTVPLRPVTLSGIIGISGYITEHFKASFRFNYSLLSIRNATAPYPPGYRKILFEWGQFNNVMSFSLCWDFKVHEF
ncbi:MAG: porin family protein [Bacteroidota bacterium]